MKHILFFLFLSFSFIAYASGDMSTAWVDKDIWPDSPQSSTIASVSTPIPSLITGAAEFSVDLHTLHAEGLSIPLRYRYHSNGIKIDDESCPWGLGWSLSPNIRLSRRIMGRPDGFYASVAEYPAYRMNHAMYYHCMTDSNLNIASLTKQNDFYLDYAPDIFTVQLANRRFSFVYVDGSFVTAGLSEYRIEADDLMQSFTITDPNGFVYKFDIKGEYNEVPQALIEWYPSKIICPSGRSIKFSYIECNLHKKNDDKEKPPHFYSRSDDVNMYSSEIKGYTHSRFYGGCHLESISFGEERISLDFTTNAVTHKRFLKDITVRMGEDELRRFTFSFEKDELMTGIVTPVGDYSFAYDSHTFHEGSGRDWWGFSNGQYVGSFHSPNLKIKGLLHRDIAFTSGSNRNISAEHMKAKILTEAIYPTGAVVNWEYEPHRFDEPLAEPDYGQWIEDSPSYHHTEGGGVRVTTVTLSNGRDDDNPKVTKYIYGKNGDGKGICRFAPTPDTFVEFKEYFFHESINGGLGENIRLKTVDILDESTFLNNHIGELPVWYDSVQEISEEGKTLYEFSEIVEQNDIRGIFYFKTSPVTISQAFSEGPQLSKKIIYAHSDTGYKQVRTECYEYDVEIGSECHGYSIVRKLNHNGVTLSAPDFSSFLIFDLRSGVGYSTHRHEDVVVFREDEIYATRQFSILPMREILVSKTVTEHFENGDFKTTENYEYVDETSLLSKSISKNGSNVETVSYSYPSTSGTAVHKAMVESNVIGLPITQNYKYGSASISQSAVMARYGTVFRPSRIDIKRVEGVSAFVPTFSWNSHGVLLALRDNSGTLVSYTWDTESRYPLTMTEGSLTTKAEWSRGNGVSALITPDQVRTVYEYDSVGRLIRNGIAGYGTLDSWSYSISRTEESHITHTSYLYSSATAQNPYQKTSYDALGRPTVDIIATYNGNGNDGWGYIATSTTYDSMGRICRSYAASPVNSSSASSAEVAEAAVAFHKDEYPFVMTEYERSQRSKVVSSLKSGEKWHQNSKKTHVKYFVNDNSIYKCENLQVTSSGGIALRGYYNTGTLIVEEREDEDGMRVRLYTDSRGKCVMKSLGDNKTYYIYDDYGDIRYILPPGLPPANYSNDSQALKSLGYSNEYDSRGRLVKSRWPGQPEKEYVYDNANRLVAETNGDLDGRWRLHFYDSCGREAFVAETSSSPDYIIGLTNARQATLTGNGLYVGYSVSLTLPLDTEVVSANYYDDYAFLDAISNADDYRYVQPPGSNALAIASPKGRQTGLFTGVGYEVCYYDKYGREIQRYGEGYSGGRKSLKYDYAGKVVEERQDYLSEFNLEPLVTTIEYDGAGNIVKRTVGIGTAKAEMSFGYDGIGRMVSSKSGTSVNRAYTYDVHGWLTGITTRFRPNPVLKPGSGIGLRMSMTEKLQYSDGPNPRYDGFISSRTIPEGQISYNYDSNGRLTEAAFVNGVGFSSDFSTRYTYDERGNILSLMRYGVIDRNPLAVTGGEQFGLLDNLTASYNGNMLTEVNGESTSATIFAGKAGASMNGKSASIVWDDAGRVKYDGARGIGSIGYNTLGMPVSIRYLSGNLRTMTYDGLGRKLSSDFETVRTGDLQRRRYYAGGLIMVNDTLERINFPGGYFDSSLSPFYYATDYQGNNVAVFNSYGYMVQETWYYPYGEPLRRPTVASTSTSENRYLYGGKEYSNYNGESEYDFEARVLAPSVIPMFTKADPLAAETPSQSPYSYCGGNPVNCVDPTGMRTNVLLNVDGEPGTYKVHSGILDDDLCVYLCVEDGDKLIRIKAIGKTPVVTTFYDSDAKVEKEEDKWRKGAIINPADESGINFITSIVEETPSPLTYAKNAGNGKIYDFKQTNGTADPSDDISSGIKETDKEIARYRGMPIGVDKESGLPIYSSARDIGNMMAGYVAGYSGLTWDITRFMFDLYQSKHDSKGWRIKKWSTEGVSSQNAQKYGFKWGNKNLHEVMENCSYGIIP